MEDVVQLNVRMPRNLRDAGNAALASVGLAPSEYIRSIWEKLAQRGQSLHDVLEHPLPAQIENESQVETPAEAPATLSPAMQHHAQLLQELHDYLGLAPGESPKMDTRSYKQIHDEAILEAYLIKDGVLKPWETLEDKGVTV